MSLRINLNQQNPIYPEQEKISKISNFSPIPTGKTKMLIFGVESDSNTFSISINFFSTNNRNVKKRFDTAFASLNTADNREISLKSKDSETFDFYYIALNTNTIKPEHQITFNLDFK